MTRSELIALMAAKNNQLSAKQVELAVNGLLASLVESLKQGRRIEIRGFGSFDLSYRRPRIGRNPRTGEILNLPAKYVPHFRPSKELRDLVNK